MNTVSIQTTHGNHHISAWNDNSIKLMPHLKGWEMFQLINHEDGTVSFKTEHDTFISASDDGSMRQQPDDKWERFSIQDAMNSDGTSLLRTHHGSFVVVVAENEHSTLRHEHAASGNSFRIILCGQPPEFVHSPRQVSEDDSNGQWELRSQCPYSCFSANALVLLADGLKAKAKDVKIGEMLMSLDGSVCKLIGRTIDNHKTNPWTVVKVKDLLITKRHPISLDGTWIRPVDLIGMKNGVECEFDEDLMNFVTEPRAAVIIDGIVVSTLGLFCDGIDSDESYFGSEAVVMDLQKNPQWPSVYRIANDGELN